MQHPGQTSDRTGNCKCCQIQPKRPLPHGLDPVFVLARRPKCEAKCRPRDGIDKTQNNQQQHIADRVVLNRVHCIQPGKIVAHIDRQPIFAAISGPRDGEIIQHLRKSQRDHDEIHAGCPQGQCTNRHGQRHRQNDRHQPDNRHRLGAMHHKRPFQHRRVRLRMEGQNTHHISAQSEKGRMAKTDQPTEPQRKVQSNPCDCKDNGARCQGDQKWFIRGPRPKRKSQKSYQKSHVQDRFLAHLMHLQTGPWAGTTRYQS